MAKSLALAFLRSEVQSVQGGDLDGYAMFILQINDHPHFKPD